MLSRSTAKVTQNKARNCKIPDDVREYVDGLGAELVANMNATGFAGKKGCISCSKKAIAWFKKEIGLNKTEWKTLSENDFPKFDWDFEIFRNGNPNDILRCLNLELKLNKERQNVFFGKDKSNNIIQKTKNKLPKLNFKFSRRIIDQTSQANSLESSINRSIQNNFVNQ